MSAPVLELTGVSVDYPVKGGTFRAVNSVSFAVEAGQTVALVGESGCGKTTLARAILGLQPYSGKIILADERVDGASRKQAKRVGMVWQDPFASLDPRWRVERLLREPGIIAGEEVDINALISSVGLDERFLNRYPHEMSGGQRQRVAIARGLALKPPLVICDEPTAALDLSIQAQVLNLLKDLQVLTQCAFLYISHDLVTVRYLCDRILVMFRGEIVEDGPTESVFENPQHPYTKVLLQSMLSQDTIGQLPEIAVYDPAIV